MSAGAVSMHKYDNYHGIRRNWGNDFKNIVTLADNEPVLINKMNYREIIIRIDWSLVGIKDVRSFY